MRLPFWEVTIYRLASGGTALIDSIACFAEKAAARNYGRQLWVMNPLLHIRVRHVGGSCATAEPSGDLNGVCDSTAEHLCRKENRLQ